MSRRIDSNHVFRMCRNEYLVPYFISYKSIFDTSLEYNLPNQIDSILPASSSIFIDAPVVPSNETPSDLLQRFSAPTLLVYINMNISEQTDNVDFAGTITTTVQRH
jgi:hypothetical protein